jgi:sigma-B regulation protein RsbU (phosphoserine phosphatase)
VPIIYTNRDGSKRPVGVINLTDRTGTDAFSGGERRLVQAIASQIAVAIENSRLVERDVEQERLRQELQLAHDLQLKLLPSPAVLGSGVEAAAHCDPARGVGGDFYNFLRLQQGRVGVMLGDVSSHGFSSALIMALVLSAAGIHAGEATSPDDALRTLLGSIETELAETEMHLALFYGVLDRASGTLRYANAGHPHAFRLTSDGNRNRLAATCPPLGLADAEGISAAEAEWRSESDLLVLFTDGIAEAVNEAGEMFGEGRVLDAVARHQNAPTQTIVDSVVREVTDFAGPASDDRTILVLRT